MSAKKSHDVVVTGMACLCAAGNSPETALQNLENEEGRQRALSPSESLDNRALPYPFFALSDDCFPEGRKHSALDTFCLAQTVVQKALAQAALPEQGLRQAGIVLGTTAGSALHFLESYAASREKPAKASVIQSHQPGRLRDRDDYFAANLALEMDVAAQGPRLTITNACTSGADAIGLGMDLIATGQCPCVVCGGADALSLVPHTGFARLMIYSNEACRPFDVNRKGLNLGEGAAALVLESAEHARQRRAPLLGRIMGYGSAADAHHFTAPHPEGRGLASAIRQALAQAGLNPEDIAFINAHGTATPENDKVEGRLLRSLLPRTPVWASKGGTGHTLGAAGALEAILSLAALQCGRLPASLGFTTPDPEIQLEPVRQSCALASPYALSTSLGFGGGNAALVLGRAEQ